MAMLINILTNGGLYFCLGFGLNCFLDKGVSSMKLLVFFINLKLNKRPKALVKRLT